MSLYNHGIFKGLYRDQGIYWRGTYNIDGSGSYRTIATARAAIDQDCAEVARYQAERNAARFAAGEAMPARKHGEYITIETPDGPLTMTLRAYRAQVFDDNSIEARYGMEIIVA